MGDDRYIARLGNGMETLRSADQCLVVAVPNEFAKATVSVLDGEEGRKETERPLQRLV